MIVDSKLKLLKSERITDFDDGGGRMTGSEVLDGELNNVFDDVSQMDRTTGRLSIRKIYGAVMTANTDPYLGAHAILTDPPDDPNVAVTMYTTESWTDTRADARGHLESYSVKGPVSRWMLFGDHVAGQKVLRLFSQPNAGSATTGTSVPSFSDGDVILLDTDGVGYPAQQQFFRVVSTKSREIWEFTDVIGGSPANFYKDVITVEVGSALLVDFPGVGPTRTSDALSAPTKVCDTTIADAARYYGVKTLLNPVTAGDSTVTVGDVVSGLSKPGPFAPLVPSAVTESPVVDVVAGATSTAWVQTSEAGAMVLDSQSFSGGSGNAAKIVFPRPIMPGSLSLLLVPGGGLTAATYQDYSGILSLPGGATGAFTGTVDYASGIVTVKRTDSSINWSVSANGSATAAAPAAAAANSGMILVTINNQALTYVASLLPAPGPGSLSVEYRSLDRWYVLRDNGNNSLVADSVGTGSGSIDYTTGSVILSLPAYPDIGSAIIFNWGTSLNYELGVSTASQPVPQPTNPTYRLTLTHTPVKPASVDISWVDNGVTRTAAANSKGVINNAYVTGEVEALTGHLRLRFSTALASGTQINVTYKQKARASETVVCTPGGDGVLSGTLTKGGSSATIDSGTLRITYNVNRKPDEQFRTGQEILTNLPEYQVTHVVRDILAPNGIDSTMAMIVGTQSVPITGSSFNLATGAFSFKGIVPYKRVVYTAPTVPPASAPSIPSGAYVMLSGKSSILVPQPVTINDVETFAGGTVSLVCSYALESEVEGPFTESLSLDKIDMDIATVTTNPILPGSLWFTYAGSTFIDNGLGGLLRDPSFTAGGGTAAGSVDYTTGLVTITSWLGSNSAPTLVVKGLVTVLGEMVKPAVFFRTPVYPLSIGQFQVRATLVDGTQITASADVNGVIESQFIHGQVDWTTGVCQLQFGGMETDATLPDRYKAATWYDANNVTPDGMIFVPALVLSSSIRYNAVGVGYLPLDASIIGVDPVRLPRDGRVPIFRSGDVAVVHNTQRQNIGTVTAGHPSGLPTAGSPLPLGGGGRTRLSYAKVYDGANQPIDTGLYTVDLNAGTIHFTASSYNNLNGQLVCEHRIEDMALVRNVLVSGQLELVSSVSHDFPSGTSFVSSALPFGNLQARVDHVFDQSTWTGAWSDTLIGSAATGTYNDTLFPLLVSNEGAVQERWAIRFTGMTTFDCYGEYSGLVGSGSIDADFAPINPITTTPETIGVPYFIIMKEGWGGNWQAGNTLRFNTTAANVPIWLARTTLQSPAYSGGGSLVEAHYNTLFLQTSWYSIWANQRYGVTPNVTYDDVTYPIVCGVGTIDERWAIVFDSPTAFTVYREGIDGPVAFGNTTQNLNITNTAVNSPYFTLDYRGWGGTAVQGNVLRFNTWAAATVPTDSFKIQLRGNAN